MAAFVDARICIILGGGGHARVLVDTLQSDDSAVEIRGILDADRSRWGSDLGGVAVLGDDELLPALVRGGVNCFAVGIGSVSDTRPRERMFLLGLSSGLEALTVVHPSAVCSRRARVGAGGQLMAGSIVNVGAILGKNVLINTAAVIEHECLLEDHVHVATGARLAGRVRVGARAHVGAGATVRQGVVIGEEAVIGVGSVVVKDVAPRTVVVGVPARFLRQAR